MSTSVFFFGGRYRQDGWRPSDVVARFTNNLWIELGKLAEPRNSHRSFEINGKILIFGGSLRYDLIGVIKRFFCWRSTGGKNNSWLFFPYFSSLDDFHFII